TILGREAAELSEAAGQRDLSHRRIGAASLECAPGIGKTRLTQPAERGRAEECPEVALEGARAHAGDRGEQVEVDRIRKMTAQPVERADKVGRQSRRGQAFRQLADRKSVV